MTNNSYAQRVAGNVRAEMARAGVTQAALARRLERKQQYLSRRIAGHIPFDVAELEQVARALGVPVESLITDHLAHAKSVPA